MVDNCCHLVLVGNTILQNCSTRNPYHCEVDLHDYILCTSLWRCPSCPATMAGLRVAGCLHGPTQLISERYCAVKSEHTASTKMGTLLPPECSKTDKCTAGIST
jgi:hypothetical protein